MTYRHEITVILLKVALNAITLTADILTGFKKATLHNIYGHNDIHKKITENGTFKKRLCAQEILLTVSY